MSQQATVATTDQIVVVSVSNNFRMHTVGVISTGVVLIDARVPGGDYEPVMDSDTSNPLQMTGSESVTLDEIALDAIKFKPQSGATYSAIVTSQASD